VKLPAELQAAAAEHRPAATAEAAVAVVAAAAAAESRRPGPSPVMKCPRGGRTYRRPAPLFFGPCLPMLDGLITARPSRRRHVGSARPMWESPSISLWSRSRPGSCESQHGRPGPHARPYASVCSRDHTSCGLRLAAIDSSLRLCGGRAHEIRSMPEPACAISMIRGSMASYFGGSRSGTTTPRRPRRTMPSMTQRSASGTTVDRSILGGDSRGHRRNRTRHRGCTGPS